MTTTTAAGKRLAKFRAASGLRLDDASAKVRDQVGPNLGVSRETIRRYETGKVKPENMDPITLAVLAEVYGTQLSELAPWVDRDEVRRLRDLLERRCSCMTAWPPDDTEESCNYKRQLRFIWPTSGRFSPPRRSGHAATTSSASPATLVSAAN